MVKRFIIPVVLLVVCFSSNAQFDTVFAKTNLRHCADSITKAFKEKNWEQYTRYSYPALIGSMGGRTEFIKYIDGMFQSIPGSAWKKYQPGKILQIIKTPGDLQAVIELTSILEWQGQRITTTTHLVGESWDGGLFWTFFDSEGDKITATLIKRDLSEELIIPAKKESVEIIKSSGKN